MKMTGKNKSDTSSFLSHVPGTRANNIPQPFITRSVCCALTLWKKVIPRSKLRIYIIQICAQHIVVLQNTEVGGGGGLEEKFGDWKKWALCSCQIIFAGNLCTNEREYSAGDADEKHLSDISQSLLTYLITGEFLQAVPTSLNQ